MKNSHLRRHFYAEKRRDLHSTRLIQYHFNILFDMVVYSSEALSIVSILLSCLAVVIARPHSHSLEVQLRSVRSVTDRAITEHVSNDAVAQENSLWPQSIRPASKLSVLMAQNIYVTSNACA